MIIQQQTWWRNYIDYLKFYEGKTSSDPNDYAKHCAPFKGAVHTNIGVTFCTFKALAPIAKIKPVTYERFLKLTDEDLSNILYYGWFNYLNLKFFKPSIALSLLELGWAAGPDQPAKILCKALAKLGHPAPYSSKITMEMINQAGKTGVNQLFSEIWNQELAYLKTLPTWPNYGNGWTTRIKAFIEKFKP